MELMEYCYDFTVKISTRQHLPSISLIDKNRGRPCESEFVPDSHSNGLWIDSDEIDHGVTRLHQWRSKRANGRSQSTDLGEAHHLKISGAIINDVSLIEDPGSP